MKSKKKFNIVIAKRDRDEYLKLCLHYLNIAAQGYDVEVTISCDDMSNLMEFNTFNFRFSNLNILWLSNEKINNFCKSKLLNKALLNMRYDFDYVSIVDIDMIYRKDFFSFLLKHMSDDLYLISHGYKLEQKSFKKLYFDTLLNIDWQNIGNLIDKNLQHEGASLTTYPSQITLSKKLYVKLVDILNTGDLYDENFIGWGGEDSYLSFFSSYCEKLGILKKQCMADIWYHIWHPSVRDNKLHNSNIEYFNSIIKINEKKAQQYLRGL